MRYRKLPGRDLEISALSFGCMRLPMNGKIVDEDRSISLIRTALSLGVNYFDTAYPYHEGKSEGILGRGLRGQREEVYVTTKLPSWLVEKRDDCDRFLDEQLKRLDTHYLDFYLLHALNHDAWIRMKQLGGTEFLQSALKDGRIRGAGFSFHGEAADFREIVDGYDWDLAQIQYNYFDRDYQAGTAGLEYAASKRIGVVVMEPLRGGTLVSRIPERVQTLWNSAVPNRSPAEWALCWLWNKSEITTVLSSMNSHEQLAENALAVANNSIGSVSADELAMLDRVAEAYRELLKVDCTNCGYCLPCPQGVYIPEIFRLYNDMFLFGAVENSRLVYRMWVPAEQKPPYCTECGECEKVCPQHLKIGELLKEAHTALAP
jgi:uncharacterized protein